MSLRNSALFDRAVFLTVAIITLLGTMTARSNSPLVTDTISQGIDFTTIPGEFTIDTDQYLRSLNDFSFDMMVKFINFDDGRLLSLSKVWHEDGFYFKFHENRLIFAFGNENWHEKANQLSSSSNLFEIGKWYRISGAKNDNVASIYIDGHQIAHGFINADVVDTTGDMKIGKQNNSASIAIKNFRLWPQPLTAQQIMGISQHLRVSDLPAPLIYYDFSNDSKTKLKNIAGNQYHGIFEHDGNDIEYQNWYILIASLALCIMIFFSISIWKKLFYRTQNFYLTKLRKIEKTDESQLNLSDIDAQRITKKIYKSIDEDMLYLNPCLKLRDLSKATGVTEHRISLVLNQYLKTNFYEFINNRRITEAKLLLQRSEKLTTLDVGIAVGFNSKSTFYSAFKKVTNQSPAQFRNCSLNQESHS